MTVNDTPAATLREAVALFAERDGFEAAVAALEAAGFERADLSLLGSHQSIDAAGKPGRPWKDALMALAGELKYEVPLVASGAVLLAGGPLAATIAGIVGAAVGGLAAREIIGEVTSSPNVESFARSLEAGGLILWVRVADAAAEKTALAILEDNGGANVHIHQTPAPGS